jgi:GntR family transcriptional regulator, transcriptional repressor for pyruvate dehydrogenase complex
MFEPVKKVNIGEQIARAICFDILEGRLQAGEKLPPERDLAMRFGTNRNTLREALKILDGLKLIRVRQGEGMTVQDYHKRGQLGLLPLYLQSEVDPGEKRRAFVDILNFRRFVLGEAVRVAAFRARGSTVEPLLQAIRECENSIDDPMVLMMKDLEFYRALIAATGSLVFTWLFNTFAEIWEQSLSMIATLWVTPDGYLDTLRQVVRHIERGQGDPAAEKLGALLKSGDSTVFGILASLVGEDEENR